MPLPLLLLGAPLLVGGGIWSGKKLVDAKRDFDDAKETNEDAKSIYADAENSLDDCRRQTQGVLEALGRRKVKLYKNGIIPFVQEFSRIKNVDFREIDTWDDLSMGDFKSEIPPLEEAALKMEEALGGAAAALGSGALAGLAAYGSVGLLGTASTGTAIAGLSGAAAKSATLAWLGGGALAAGGLGVAGGTGVLSGIVALPVLLVGSHVLASKAEEAKEDARSNREKARAAAEGMKDAAAATGAIGRRATEVDETLRRLDEQFFFPGLLDLRTLVRGETDYRRYSRADKELVCRVASIAVTAKNLIEAPLLTEKGAITQKIRETLRRTREFLADLVAKQHPGAAPSAT